MSAILSTRKLTMIKSSNRDLNSQIILVTGAARSGKSDWAEYLAKNINKPVSYIATAQTNIHDPEWLARIERHKQKRPTDWQTLEIPIDLALTINKATYSQCLLIDSLGTWVANLLDENDSVWNQIHHQLIQSLTIAKVDIILVAEETGWGVIPAYKTGRLFRDRLGFLVREIGAIAGTVYLVTGGHALNLSLLGQPIMSND